MSTASSRTAVLTLPGGEVELTYGVSTQRTFFVDASAMPGAGTPQAADHLLLSELAPWLEPVLALRGADAETGAPPDACAQAWYWYSIEKQLRRGHEVHWPPGYLHMSRAQRAASYLRCDPSLFQQVEDAAPAHMVSTFIHIVDSLRPGWVLQAAAVRSLYRLALP